MSLHVCKCGYSTKIKCNYIKHTKICKQYEQPTNDIFSQRLTELQAKYDEQIAEMEQKHGEEIKRLKGIIHDLQKKKKPDDDDETYRIRLMKMCKRKGIAYNEEDSLDTLRKLYTSQQGGN